MPEATSKPIVDDLQEAYFAGTFIWSRYSGLLS
jgi:hypothetical protein